MTQQTSDKVQRLRYRETSDAIRDLKSQLPEKVVEALAGEVLQRVAARGTRLAAAPDAETADAGTERLARALIGTDHDAALHIIEDLREAGASIDDIYLVHLASAARRLGEMWDGDQISFVDVTVGTSRIYGILRTLDEGRGTALGKTSRSALFVTVPGEEHTLGVRMAADLFRRRGWDIEVLVGLGHDEIVERVDDTTHLVIGLSSSGPRTIAALARLVLAIRIQRPQVRIVVSGQAVETQRDLVEAMSPDGIVSDVEEAVEVLTDLWADVTTAAE